MGDSDSSLLPWLSLSLVPGVTGTSWRRLLARFGSPAQALKQSASTLEAVVGPATARAIVQGPPPDRLQQALDWANLEGQCILTPGDERYPGLLAETPAAPPVLYAAGRTELLQRHALAVVGSRSATAQGIRNAEALARALAASGLCVVSGLAAGIDAAAHRAAVDEAGSTIAVLGNGIDIAYPRRNAPLYDRIRTRGLILSEFPLGTPPLSTHFPRRNRIISGLARGCLVIEAAMASGSLITARLAVEMGRDVFAVPGSIHSPLSRGCHYLIKQGAKLVETADDVLEELGMASGGPDKTQAPNARLPAGNAGKLLNAFGHASCDIDTLVAISGIEVDELLALLVELELEGWVSRLADGSYQRVK